MEHLTRIKNIARCATFFSLKQIMNFNSSAILLVKGLPIKMPSLSPTMSEGNIVKWLKNEGDLVQPGDILCDIQTDKAVASLETEEEGILAKILVKEDTKIIEVGTLIALLVEGGEDWKNVEIPDEGLVSSLEAPIQNNDAESKTCKSLKYGPSVRLLLQKYGLSEDKIPFGGPHGFALKSDILQYVKEKNIEPLNLKKVSAKLQDKEPKVEKLNITSGFSSYKDKINVKKFVNSKIGIAHTYSTFDCSLDAITKLVKEMEKEDSRVNVDDWIIKCVASTLQSSPEVNCVWENDKLVEKKEVDISITVVTEYGVFTPTMKNVTNLGVEAISAMIKNLTDKAQKNELSLDESQKGSFTIFNLGTFGVKEFRAIINPPQCAVLAVGESRIVLNDDNEKNIRMTATLSYDQAAISDEEAALFLQNLKKLLENPNLILFGNFKQESVQRSFRI